MVILIMTCVRLALAALVVGAFLIAFYGAIWIPLFNLFAEATDQSGTLVRTCRGCGAFLGGLIYIAYMLLPMFIGVGLVYGLSGVEDYRKNNPLPEVYERPSPPLGVGVVVVIYVAVIGIVPFLWAASVFMGGLAANEYFSACVWGDTCAQYHFR